jgi:subtilisin-like proprotein convertase family protein
MKFMSFFSRFGKNWRAKTKERRPRASKIPAALIAVEELEVRTLLSVLPSPVIDGQTTGVNALKITGLSPQVVVDPINPQKVVAVASTGGNGYTVLASADGGFSWKKSSFANVPDPNNPPNFPPYAQNTDAAVTMDRNDNVYIVMREHDATNTSGALVFEKFTISTDPTSVTTPVLTQPIKNKILYRWIGPQAIYNPTIAFDNNLPSYTDPQTGQVQTDTMAGKAIYVAWNTAYSQAPSIDNRYPNPLQLDVNGIKTTGGGAYPYDPNTIKLIASADGGLSFSKQEFANDLGLFLSMTSPSTPDPNYGIPASSPKIVFTQGTAGGQVPGGEMAIIWNNIAGMFNNDTRTKMVSTGFTVDRSQPDLGIPSMPAVAVNQVTWTPTGGFGQRINDGILSGNTAGGGGLPDIPGETDVPLTVNITDPNFDSLTDLSVTLSIFHPHPDELKVVLVAPDGKTFVTLINNYMDPAGMAANSVSTGAPLWGLADSPNIGINTSSTMGFAGAQVVGVTFDQQAPQPIDDRGLSTPILGLYRPDDLGGPAGFAGPFGGSNLNFGGLNKFQGWVPVDTTGTGQSLNGTWTLKIFDTREDRLGPNNDAPNFNQFLVGWSLNFTAHMSTTQFGFDTAVAGFATLSISAAPNKFDVLGSANDIYPSVPGVSPNTGVGPNFSVAVDNTLGSFSPFQGRIYLAATAPGYNTVPPPPDDTDVYLAYSDDGGGTWTFPSRINDDSAGDGFSDGTRPQFMPELAVDPTTGTLVVTYFDGRYDPARARIVSSIQTSIDGGNTFSATTYLNVPKTATDAISGKTIVQQPIPTNIGPAGALGVGDRQGLAVYGGHVYAFWSGNLNAANVTVNGVTSGAQIIETADVTIAGGPRVLSGDQGPVIAAGSTNTYNNTFTSDGTRQLDGFQIQFDRPVDPATVNPGDIQLNFRDPNTPASQPGTDLSNQITSVTPLDQDSNLPALGISIGNAIVLEGANAMALFPVVLTGAQFTDVTLNVAASDVTAKQGVNYTTPATTVTIPAGMTSALVTVPILVDTDTDADSSPSETFAVNISGAPTGFTITRSQGIGTIVDTTTSRSLSVGDGIAVAGLTPGTTGMLIPVILNQPTFQNVTVHYSTANGTAIAGTDYVASSGTVTIPAGMTRANILVPIINTTAFGPNRVFTITIDTPPIGIGIARSQGTGIVVRAGTVTPLTINVGDAIIRRGQSGVTDMLFPVILSMPQTSPVFVSYATADPTPADLVNLPPSDHAANSTGANPDYVPASGIVTIPAEQRTGTITVHVNGNTIPQGNAAFLLNLTLGSGTVSLGRAQAIGTIVDPNNAPSVTVGNATAQGPQGTTTTGTITFPVFLSAASSQPVTVNYATADGSAVAGVDYTAVTAGSVMIPASQTSATITVQLLNANAAAADRTFFINLANPTNANLATTQAVGTIVDSPVAISIGNASVFEGNTGTTAMVFPVYLNGPSGNTVTVNYATADITGAANAAAAGTDYQATSNTLTFTPGQTSAAITVLVNGDLIPNPTNKIFFVNLTNPVNAGLNVGQAVGTIVDDDSVPTLTAGNAIALEGTNALVPVYLSYALPSGDDVKVAYTMTDVTAMGGADYTSSAGSLTIPGGKTSATLTIPITATVNQEPDLTFTVNLNTVTSHRPSTTVPNAGIVGAAGTVTIVHDGVAISIGDGSFAVNPATGTIVETFNVFLSSPSAKTVTASYLTANGSAMVTVDYAKAMGMVTFAPGVTMQSIPVTILSAPTTASVKTFTVSLSNITNADPRGTVSRLTANGAIYHTDGQSATPPLPVEVSIGNVSGFEGNVGTTLFAVPVVLNQVPGSTVTVNYATVGTGIIPSMGTLTFTTGAPQFVNVQVVGNTVDNQVNGATSGNRSFSVVLSAPTNAAIAPGMGIGTGLIIDDDALTATVGSATVLKGQTGTVNAVFPVFLTNPAKTQVTISYSTVDMTATAPRDYQAVNNGSLVIPQGATSANITVVVNGNSLVEGNTQFGINITQINGAAAAVGAPPTVGTIIDQNNLAITIGDVSLRDGPAGGTAAMVFPVYLNAATNFPITVDYTTQDYTAHGTGAGADYQPTSGTLAQGTALTFQPGQTTAFITVLINGDSVAEPNKLFTVNLSNSRGAGILTPQGIGTILDDDLTPGITIGDAAVLKPSQNGQTTLAVFPVFLSFPLPADPTTHSTDITVPYTTADGTATAGEGDYGAINNGSLVIPGGTTTAFITVTVNGDTQPEGNETFLVNLGQPTLGATRTRGTATGLIIESNAVPTVNIGDVILDKTPSLPTNVVFPVLLSGPAPAGGVTVHYATADGSAVAGINYVGTSGNLNLPAGFVSGAITVAVLGNSIQEGTKDFFVNLTSPTGATLAKNQGAGTIVDDTGQFGATLFLVKFSPQNKTGTYSYAIGPFIRDRIRTAVPSIDPIPGNGATIYHPPNSQVDIGVPLVPETIDTMGMLVQTHTDSTLTISGVPASQVIRDMTVNLSINYARPDHLVIELIAPNGAGADSLAVNEPVPPAAPYTIGANYFNTTFDDLAAVPISSYHAQPPFDGSFRPEQALSGFDGLSPNGTWTLRILAFDPMTMAPDPIGFGILANWSLNIQTGVLVPTGSAGNFMDQNSDAFTVDQTRNNEDIFAAPQQTNGVPEQPAGSPATLPGGATATVTTSAPFQLPYTHNSLPLIIPGPYVVPFNFATGSLVQAPNPQPLNLAIPDATTINNGGTVVEGVLTSQITIADIPFGQVLSNLKVTVDINHQQVSDLRLTLIAPDGTQVLLSDRNPQGPGFSGLIQYLPGANFDDTTFDDNATLPIREPVTNPPTPPPLPPFPGSYQPQTPLSTLYGKSLNGTWTLKIEDLFPGNIGTLLGWSLTAENTAVLNSATSSVDVNFNRLIDPTTFKPANVLRIIGPAGAVPLTDSGGNSLITIVPLLADGTPQNPLNLMPTRNFRVMFPTQSAAGNYSVVVGPDPTNQNAYIQSPGGDKVDINQNAGLPALRGEDLTGGPPVPITTTNSTPTTLPVGKLTLVPITVNDNFVIQGTTVTVNISDQYDPSLSAVLYAPDGTAIKLFTNVGASAPAGHPPPGPGPQQADFLDTVFDDAASLNGQPHPIQLGAPPFNSAPGSYNPQEPLSVLDGKSSRGTWYLAIFNSGAQFSVVGTLNHWSLTLQKSVTTNTGLGEPVADQFSVGFHIFISDPTQPLSKTQWTPVGPAANNNQNNSGRVSALAVDPSDPSGNTVYIGAASGGIWKTTNFLTSDPLGPNWVALTDFGPAFSLNIGGLVVIPHNNDPNQSIIIAATGEGNTQSPGVGFLRSMDGGKTWQVLDSLTNVDAGGNVLGINDPARLHDLVGTTAYKLVADIPDTTKFPSANVILYAALGNGPTNNVGLPSSNNGGLYRSTDLGNHWVLMQAGYATDVQIAAGSVGAGGNALIVYGAIEGQGAYFSPGDAPFVTNGGMLLMGGGAPSGLIRSDQVNPDDAVPVAPTPTITPDGAKGRITLAVPALTGNPLLDSFYQGWVYALVAANGNDANGLMQSSEIDGLYMTKDFGSTWTQVNVPMLMGNPTNNNLLPNVDPLSPHRPNQGSHFPQANYNISMTVDPNNPNIVYVGGTDYEQAGLGVIRIDVTRISDPYALVPYDNLLNDGGITMINTTGDIIVNKPGNFFGVADPFTLPPYQPNGLFEQYTGENAPPLSPALMGSTPDLVTKTGGYYNLQRDPANPFLRNSTVRVTGVGNIDPATRQLIPDIGFTNTGYDVSWNTFEPALTGTASYFAINAYKDPLTGFTRLIFGTGEGVYTEVDDGTGTLSTGIGSLTNANGSRNGDLQITQFFYGTAQPSSLATELAGALFYGSARENGFPSSSGGILQSGDLNWVGIEGDGAGVGVDQTGGGTMYQYRWPCCLDTVRGNPSGTQFTNTDFFQVTKPGQKTFGATMGLVTQANNPGMNQGQWPFPIFPVGSSFVQSAGGPNIAVNPVDGQAIVMGTPGVPGQAATAGGLYLTTTGGANWFPIAAPSNLDGTYTPALAFGAPTPGAPAGNLDNFIYAGTMGGHVYVSTTGSAPWKDITGGAFGSAGALDGSAVQAIVPDTHRGSTDLYLATANGVYYMADSSSATPTWINITGNLFSTALTRPLFNVPTQLGNTLKYLTSLVADWRFAIPNVPGNTKAGTHPVLYAAGEGGVFRSIDNGATWAFYPGPAQGAAQAGGYLPDAHVTDLTLALGNIDPTTGQPSQPTGYNMLVASTYGRGMFTIRLNNADVQQYATNPIDGPYVVSAGLATTTGTVSAINVTFSGPVDPATFTVGDIKQIIGPGGVSITPLSIVDITKPDAHGNNFHNVYQITFAPQTTPGVYSVTFGPAISDFSGNQMDQNRNGINGEAFTPDALTDPDAYTGHFYFGTSANPAVPPPAVPEIVTRIQDSPSTPQSGQLLVGVTNGFNGFTFTQWGQISGETPSFHWVDIHTGNFTGDGQQDIIARVAETGQWWVGVSNGRTFTNELWATWAPNTATFQWQDVVVGDFNGDGKLDIAGRESGNGKWWVGLSTGHSFQTAFWTAWSPNIPGKFDWVNVMTGDFNGDGKTDIIGRVKETGAWYVNISTGAVFSTQFWTAWSPDHPGTFDWVDVQTGDFNGDGKTDIVGRILEYGQWWVNLSTGISFRTTYWDAWSAGPNFTWVDVRVGDFNGDGLSDIIGRRKQTGDWYVSTSVLANGATSYATTWPVDVPGTTDWVDVVVGDFNGDGKTDLAGRNKETGGWWVSLANATGTGFQPQALWAVLDPKHTYVNTQVANLG